MLKREAIKKTVVTYWSNEDECFIAESSLFPRITAMGNTVVEALKEFAESLEDVYEYIEIGKVSGYDKRGRPAKGRVDMHIQVRPQTKKLIDTFRCGLDISQGEVIDYFASFADAASKVAPATQVFIVNSNQLQSISAFCMVGLDSGETVYYKGSKYTNNVVELRKANPIAA